jgi:hypothetical protein
MLFTRQKKRLFATAVYRLLLAIPDSRSSQCVTFLQKSPASQYCRVLDTIKIADALHISSNIWSNVSIAALALVIGYLYAS